MKKLILVFLILFSVSFVSAALDDDFLVCWDFNTDTLGQTTCTDRTGNGNNFSVGADSTGIVVDGYNYNGYSDDGINTGKGCSGEATNMIGINHTTIYAKIKIFDTRVAKAVFMAGNQRYFLYVSSDPTFVINGLSDNREDSPYKVLKDTWTDIFGFYNGTHICIEVNNSLTCDVSSGTPTMDDQTSSIGSHGTSNSNSIFNGTIDNVMIWNRSLSKAERNEIFAIGANLECANITGEAPQVDPCEEPATGDFDVDCSNSCNWTIADTIPGNISMTGPGIVTLSTNWTFTSINQHINIGSGCEFRMLSGSVTQ